MLNEETRQKEKKIKMFGGRLKIIVIDDEKSVLDTARTALSNMGHLVITFFSGAEAVKYFSEDETCDLIFIDLVMPDLDGLTTIERIKSLLPDVKIVVISGYYAEFGKEYVDLYLPKPLTYQNLKDAVKEVTSEKRGIEND
jgi:two-component SAPR family response regulator